MVVFTDTKPLVDTDVLEPRLVSQSEFSEGIGTKNFQTFERVVVVRTAVTWRVEDGSVWLQIANPSTRGVTIPAHLTLALLSTASVTDTPEFRISEVATSPKNKDALAVARDALEPALVKHLLTPPSPPNKFRRSYTYALSTALFFIVSG